MNEAGHRRCWVRLRTLLLLALVMATLGCGRNDAAPAGDGGPKPHRVVSLSPSTTEAMFAIGAGHLLVGRSTQCDVPTAARALPSVGGFAGPNIEAIVALRPTLVIGSRSPVGPSLEQRLHGHGIDTLFPPTRSVSDVAKLLTLLGERFEAGAGASKAVSALQGRVGRIQAWVAARPKVSAVMVFDASPIFVAGPGSFGDELLSLAGGKNLVDHGGSYPTIDIERLLTLDPDVIIDAVAVGQGAPGSSTLKSSPGWSALRAVKTGRVRLLRSSAALRPGPRIAEGLADVAGALHDAPPPP
ncbi:MAG: ABC transporter substrate-binding protein [Deltaproteobacteria bacterium]|nr:ABC transporter substrate-binding protein [Deltaproteobacteria bacterium]